MRRGMISMLMLSVIVLLCAILVGCKPSPEEIAAHKKYYDESIKKAKTIEGLVIAFGLDEEFRLLYQDEMKGLHGEIHGSYHGSFSFGSGSSSGSLDGSLENAKSTILWWQDRNGTVRQNVLPSEEVCFKVREGAPASVKFDLNIGYMTVAETKISFNAIKDKWDRDALFRELDGEISYWIQANLNPAPFIKDNLRMATVYAPRKDLRRYFHVIVP